MEKEELMQSRAADYATGIEGKDNQWSNMSNQIEQSAKVGSMSGSGSILWVYGSFLHISPFLIFIIRHLREGG